MLKKAPVGPHRALCPISPLAPNSPHGPRCAPQTKKAQPNGRAFQQCPVAPLPAFQQHIHANQQEQHARQQRAQHRRHVIHQAQRAEDLVQHVEQEAEADAGHHADAHRHAAQRAEDERQRHQHHHRHGKRREDFAPHVQLVAVGLLAALLQVLHVVVQPADGKRGGIQRHHAQLVRGQVGFPFAGQRLGAGHLFFVGQVGGIHLRKLPHPAFKAGGSGVAHRLQPALVVEVVNVHAGKLFLAGDALDVDEVVAVLRPQPALGGKQRTAVHLLRAVVARHLVALRRHPLADRHGQQYQRNGGFHHRAGDLHAGKAGGLHHHQLAARRQLAQAEQRAQQRRHREEGLDVFRHAQQGKHAGAQRAVIALAHSAQLIDELDDAGQRHQHEQRHDDGVENRFTDITVQYAKHQAAPLRRARSLRIGTVSHRFSASAMTK